MSPAVAPPFGRLVTAMVTPFDRDGRLDLGQAERIAHHLVATGSDAVFVAGTTGESPTLSDDEKIELCRTVVHAVGKSAKVLAGTGTYDTAHSVQLSRRAASVGVDGLVAVTPYYNRPPQRGLVAHFTAIADSTELPLLLYNIPSRTARLVDASTVCALAAHPRIVGVKDSTGDVTHTAAVRAGTPDEFVIYAGDDVSTLSVMSAGGAGVVSVAAHVAGPFVRSMVDAYCDGLVATATTEFLRLQPLLDALFLEPNPIPIKAALRLVGLHAGDPRLPLVPAEAATVDALRAALGSLDATEDTAA